MRILVVDREEELKPMVEILGKTPGNEIITATAGQQALDMMEGQHLDLLITEVFLDPMNGFTLRNKMENRHGGVRTIFASAYDLSPYREHTEGYQVVAKPVTPEKLFPAVARALAPVNQVPAGQPAPATVPQAAPVAVQQPPPASAPLFVPQAATAPRAATAAPVAVPVPRAVPQAALTPAPTQPAAPISTPVAVPRATPAAVPSPTATPRATPAPVAVPRAASIPQAKAAPVAVRPAAVAADPMIGRTLGNYQVQRRIGTGKWGPVYQAIQTSMNRPVAMEILGEETAGDENARQNFVATARAKAAVSHPHILSVYEADQGENRYFYTHEFVDGSTLSQMARRGEGLAEHQALQVIKHVSQALGHLHHNRIPHSIPDASDIYVGVDGVPYLSNIALPAGEITPPQQDIKALGEAVRAVLPGGRAQERGLEAMLTRMQLAGSNGYLSIPALLQAVQAIEPKVVPVDAFKLSAQDEAAIRAVEDARKRQKRQVLYSIGGLFVLLWVIGFAVWWQFMRPVTIDHSDDMVRIPAGEFIYGQSEKRTLKEFYIDKYEVTMAEYAKFLAYLAANGNPPTYDHPLQPKGRSHVPRDWDVYYGRASSSLPQYRNARGVPISLECPVFNVDYFDAYAYAAWKGRRLPTDEEWEKAARGTAGNLYPWGADWDPKKTNSGADYKAEPPPGYKPDVDGYVWWAPVTAFPDDKSPYGVIGMAGNVSEWTSSWDEGKTTLVIRGGNFKYGPERAVTTSSTKADPTAYAVTLGFRTASDGPPRK